MIPASHPILSTEDALAFEAALFRGDETREWEAMGRAGRGVASAALRDFQEIGGLPACGRVLVLAGKGNNAGDALIAAKSVVEAFPAVHVDVVFVFGNRTLRPLAMRAWRELQQAGPDRVTAIGPEMLSPEPSYDLCLDGVFGLQFKAPLAGQAAEALQLANKLPVRLRAAVDLPSGLDDTSAFRADFTYATGILKDSLLGCSNAGRLRYLDLGFFGSDSSATARKSRVLLRSVLGPLAALRPSHSDKRSFGHLFILAGSRSYPGAALMAVQAALHSGVGLVTALVPESLSAAFAAQAPEAMWVGLPETAGGGLASKGAHLLASRMHGATAVLAGPGLGRDPETLSLVGALLKTSSVPFLLDADALQPDLVGSAIATLVLTPHAGEYARLGGGEDLPAYCSKAKAVVVLKGPTTRICAGTPATVFHSIFGGPVLARGGSGDLLAGLTGGLLAQTPAEPLLAACRGAVWHGSAADALARARGQTGVKVTQLLDHLPEVLRQPDVL
jgi:NAD(P)H-hydrate epimerase